MLMHPFFSTDGRHLLTVFLLARWRVVLFALVLDLLANVCVIGLSLLLAHTVAALFGFHSVRGGLLGIQPGNVSSMFVWLAITITVKFLLDYARLRLRGVLSEDFAHHLRTLAFDQHLRADLRHHETREMGRSLLRFSGDLSSAQRLLTRGILQYAADLALLLMGIGVIAWLEGHLALLVCGLTVTVWFLTLLINRRLRSVEVHRRSKKAGLLAMVNTTLVNLSGIQALNRSTRTLQNFGSKAEKVRTWGYRYHRLAAASESLPLFFVQMLLLAVMVSGWQSGVSGSILFMVALVLMSWRSPLSRLLRVGLVWKKGLLSLEKIDVLFRSPAAVGGDAVLEKKHGRTLHLQDVCLRFGEKTVLHNISFHLSVGETLCLNIGTGGGKTALTKLLAGLYSPDSGAINWNGQAAETFNTHSLRRQIAFVSEAFPLIGNTLLDALSNSSQSKALAQAETEFRYWQTRFPMLQHLDLQQKATVRSPQFSTGQQRLLQCLRAVLADKPFLVLDDPFAGLDVDTAKTLANILEELQEKKGILLLTSQPELLAEIKSKWMPAKPL